MNINELKKAFDDYIALLNQHGIPITNIAIGGASALVFWYADREDPIHIEAPYLELWVEPNQQVDLLRKTEGEYIIDFYGRYRHDPLPGVVTYYKDVVIHREVNGAPLLTPRQLYINALSYEETSRDHIRTFNALYRWDQDRTGRPDGRQEILDEAIAFIRKNGRVEGASHKAWVIDQVFRVLTGLDYLNEVDDSWDLGTPP